MLVSLKIKIYWLLAPIIGNWWISTTNKEKQSWQSKQKIKSRTKIQMASRANPNMAQNFKQMLDVWHLYVAFICSIFSSVSTIAMRVIRRIKHHLFVLVRQVSKSIKLFQKCLWIIYLVEFFPCWSGHACTLNSGCFHSHCGHECQWCGSGLPSASLP